MNIDENYAKWKQIGFFSEDTDYNKTIAILLENQRLYNTNIEDRNSEFMQWKRCSIPIVCRVYDVAPPYDEHFLLPELIAFRPMYTPTTYVSGGKNNGETHSISAITRNTRTMFVVRDESQIKMDDEAEATIETVASLRQELYREVIGNLRTNCTKLETDRVIKTEKDLEAAIEYAADVIYEKSGLWPNWAVIPPEIGTSVFGAFPDPYPFTSQVYPPLLKKRGMFKDRWNIYESPMMETILVGCKDDNNIGYVYCPLNLACLEGGHVVSRHAKRLFNDGKQYANMVVRAK